MGVVERALPNVASGIREHPRRAGVVGAKESAVFILDDRVHTIGISAGHGDADLAVEAGGNPGLRVISVQCSPPSVDLYKPLPGPPLDIEYSTRKASQSAAYITFGLCGSIEMSMPPDFASLNNTRRHVLPPSVDL